MKYIKLFENSDPIKTIHKIEDVIVDFNDKYNLIKCEVYQYAPNVDEDIFRIYIEVDGGEYKLESIYNMRDEIISRLKKFFKYVYITYCGIGTIIIGIDLSRKNNNDYEYL